MSELIRRHETGAFVALTFGLAWLPWLLSGVLGRADLRAPDWRWATVQVGVFAPALAGLLVATCVEPGAGRRARRTTAGDRVRGGCARCCVRDRRAGRTSHSAAFSSSGAGYGFSTTAPELFCVSRVMRRSVSSSFCEQNLERAQGAEDIPVIGNIDQVSQLLQMLSNNDEQGLTDALGWKLLVPLTPSLQRLLMFVRGEIDHITVVLNTDAMQSMGLGDHWIAVRIERMQDETLKSYFMDSFNGDNDYGSLLFSLQWALAHA